MWIYLGYFIKFLKTWIILTFGDTTLSSTEDFSFHFLLKPSEIIQVLILFSKIIWGCCIMRAPLETILISTNSGGTGMNLSTVSET